MAKAYPVPLAYLSNRKVVHFCIRLSDIAVSIAPVRSTEGRLPETANFGCGVAPIPVGIARFPVDIATVLRKLIRSRKLLRAWLDECCGMKGILNEWLA